MDLLIMQGLAELEVGERIQLTYGDNESHTVTGTVAATDHIGSMKFVTDSGRKMMLRYEQVKTFEWLDDAIPPTTEKVETDFPSERAPKIGLGQNGRDFGGETGTKADLKKKSDSLVDQSCSVLNVNLNDSELKSLYDTMPKNDRTKLNSFYDRYKAGEKANDKSKMRIAATKAADMIRNEADNGYIWSQEALKLCGGMLRRQNCYDEDLFLLGDMYPEAARFALGMKDFINGAAYAAIALFDAAPELEHDLLIILAKCSYLTQDVSALRIIKSQLPMRYETLMSLYIKDLLEKRNISVPDGMPFDQKVQTLEVQYPNRNVIAVINSILGIETTEAGSDTLESAATEQSESDDVREIVTHLSEQEKGIQPQTGWISKIQWLLTRGEISCNGTSYSFNYSDIKDKDLQRRVEQCTGTEMDGNTCWVSFEEQNGAAKKIVSCDPPLREASQYANKYDYYTAVDWCKTAIGSPDEPEALAAMVEYAVLAAAQQRDYEFLETIERIYDENRGNYPQKPRAISFLAQLYFHLNDHLTALDYMDQALDMPDLNPKLRITYLALYARYCQQYTNEEINEQVCEACIERSEEWLELFEKEESLREDPQTLKYYPKILSWKCHAECILERLDDAEEDMSLLIQAQPNSRDIQKLQDEIRELRKKEARRRLINAKRDEIPAGDGDPVENNEPFILPPPEDEDVEGVAPYEDTDGWNALNLSESDVIDYALGISGDNALPIALTYLRAGTRLNRKIAPIYNMLALAVNDPSYASDYTAAGLISMLDACDPSYQQLNDYCMSAAFLRTSFQAGRGYDYSAKGVQDSISMLQRNPILHDICDLLEAFRNAAGMAVDIYADYRNRDVMQLNMDLDNLVRQASDLNTKYILTPQRDSVLYVRMTKQLIFARDGYFATMLQQIMSQDRGALESAKLDFAERFLNSSNQFSDKNVSSQKVDKLIAESWEQAGRDMTGRKVSGTLQGERRNNLRSNITDILKVICQWYTLSEQSAGLSWRTPEGESTYERMKPQLIEKFDELSQECAEKLNSELSAPCRMGVYALAHTAQELAARLNGEWSFGQERYMFVDFLKSDNIMLDDDFLPELDSTFCILPKFNVLARIRKHIEEARLPFDARIRQIYSPDRSHNNYGSADKIVKYLHATGQENTVSVPANAEQYVAQTEQQIQIRFRSFLESYALAVNYGQIMQTDSFCCTLEDTVRFWYRESRATKNYGFFTMIMQAADEQIHASAQQYEAMLDNQLDSLIENNRTEFDRNPGYEEAIRTQINQQNFIVAEDWMNRIRAKDFSLVLEQPVALKNLENFWNSYGDIYRHVSDTSSSVKNLFNHYGIGGYSEKASRLIQCWMDENRCMDNERITEILNLLGWPSVTVEEVDFVGGARTEIYRVRQEPKAVNTVAPPHPIAAFGSLVAEQGMYVACLYDSYSSDSLYEKIRILDSMNGNKLILLDCALGVADRHALARKLKQKESGIQNVYLVVDRVALYYLAENYNEDLVNKNLMAIGIPFSYCMPYVVASILPMPPEIFIGRKHELSEIESPTGVNLIYGGRQLGKSALFKKARVDIDGNQGRRAILVDINGCSCSSAARKLAGELAAYGILSETDVTDDWDLLCERIVQTLRGEDSAKYLLVMLDEADAFIRDCGTVNYDPIIKLKDVQQTLPGRFKFVLAGLHDIIRFNKMIALGNNAVITHMPSLKVTPFHAPEAEELLTVPLSYLGLSLPSKVTVSQVLATVNYFPGLIQLYSQKLIESLRAADYAGYDQRKTPPYVITDDHIRRVMADKDFVHQIHDKFLDTLLLDQDQGYCYYPLALLFGWMYYEEPQKSKQAGYAANDILRYAKEFGVRQIIGLDVERINALLSELEDLNILRSISGSTYVFASKSFRDLLGSYEEIFEQLSKFGGEQE